MSQVPTSRRGHGKSYGTDAPIKHTIGSVVNGVSQQPPRIRLDSQCEEQVNMLSAVIDGASRRPPSEHVCGPNDSDGLPTTIPSGGYFTHVINRDLTERYLVLIEDNDIRVFDFAGTEATVTKVGAAASDNYLDIDAAGGELARDSFAAVSVADYTFIVNKTKVVAASGTTATDRRNEFLLYIKDASATNSPTYKLFVNDANAVSTNAATEDTTAIASNLMNALTGGTTGTDVTGTATGWTNWKFTRNTDESWLYGYQFQNATETPYFTDSRGNSFSTFIYNDVQAFSDLPRTAPDAFVARVTGAGGDELGSYWVKYERDARRWVETVGYDADDKVSGLDNGFDPDTMPHLLVRTGTSPLTFDWKQAAWLAREKGDNVTSPDPAFVGETINDVFFFDNRLGLLAGEGGHLSEVGEYFNFWPTTATTVVESDVIHFSATSNQVAIQDYAVPFDENLTLFSAQGGVQHELRSAGSVMSPSNARVVERTSFETAPAISPVPLGRALFFAVDRETASGVMEYTVRANERPDADDITAHITRYLPGSLQFFTGSASESTLAMADGVDGAVYVYRYYYADDQKLMASWSKWEFGGGAEVLGLRFLGSVLMVVLKRSDGVYLEKVNLRTLVDGGFTHRCYLDSLVELTGVYSAGTGLTTWTLPYKPVGSEAYEVVLSDASWGDQLGKIIPSTFSPSVLTVTADGDWSAYPALLGRKVSFTYEFSEPSLDDGQSGGQAQPVTGDRLQVKWFRVFFKNTGAFEAQVRFKYGQDDTFEYPFTGRFLDDALTQIGPVQLYTGQHRFRVGGVADSVRVILTGDSYLPFTLTAAEWKGHYVSDASDA